MEDTEEIKIQMQKDIEQLYIEIGQQLLADQEFAFPVPNIHYVTHAKNWIYQHKEQFIEEICTNGHIKLIHNSPRLEDRIQLVASIIDLIAGLCIGISPVKVSVLLVKEGIRTLCSWDT